MLSRREWQGINLEESQFIYQHPEEHRSQSNRNSLDIILCRGNWME